MKFSNTAQTLGLAAAQLEAASSLLKYAADDLAELILRENVPLTQDIAKIIEKLQEQALTVAGSGAFLVRLAEETDAPETDTQQAWTAAAS